MAKTASLLLLLGFVAWCLAPTARGLIFQPIHIHNHTGWDIADQAIRVHLDHIELQLLAAHPDSTHPPREQMHLAFVLTVDPTSPRSQHSFKLLDACGFHVLPFIPPKISAAVTSGVCSNLFGHLGMLWHYSKISRAPRYGWFFEDDIALPPGLDPPTVNHIVQHIMTRPSQPTEGVIYLGGCGFYPAPTDPVYMEQPLVKYALGDYSCAHAYGFSLPLAEKAQSWFSGTCDWHYFDVILKKYGQTQVPSILIGANFRSPQFGDHSGLFFQDRSKFPSIVNQF
jgi:hypothetical protein